MQVCRKDDAFVERILVPTTSLLSCMQVDGKVVDGPDLTVKHFSGLTLPNPFVIGSGTLSLLSTDVQGHLQQFAFMISPCHEILWNVIVLDRAMLHAHARQQNEGPNQSTGAAGPPGTNYAVMKKAFDEGWGAVIAKTVSLDCSKVCRKA